MDFSSLIADFLTLVPEGSVGTVAAVISFVISACAVAVRFWKPPSATSSMAGFYKIITALAQARGWNASAYQPDRKAVMVPVEHDRVEIADRLGLKVDDTRP